MTPPLRLRLVLDENILAKIVHPRAHQEVRDWFRRAAMVHAIYVPEVADYELRRELILDGFEPSIALLDRLRSAAEYLPCTTENWRAAAGLWAVLRKTHQASSADRSLDGDMLIAAQALSVGGVVVTGNLKHFQRVVAAMDWPDVPLE